MIREDATDNIKQPIEFIVRYETKNDSKIGEYGLPLIIEEAIPYEHTRHVPIIGMITYLPKNEEEEKSLQTIIEEAYDKGIIKSYERIERNIELKEKTDFNSSDNPED